MKPEEFDKQFLAWLEAEIEERPSTASTSGRRRSEVRMLRQANQELDDVIKEGDGDPRHLSGLRREHGSAYELLAEAYLAKGDKAKAMARAGALLGRSAAGIPRLLKKLATLQEEAGRKHGSAPTL